jgi:hypothetical protein
MRIRGRTTTATAPPTAVPTASFTGLTVPFNQILVLRTPPLNTPVTVTALPSAWSRGQTVAKNLGQSALFTVEKILATVLLRGAANGRYKFLAKVHRGYRDPIR